MIPVDAEDTSDAQELERDIVDEVVDVEHATLLGSAYALEGHRCCLTLSAQDRETTTVDSLFWVTGRSRSSSGDSRSDSRSSI